MSLPGSVIAHTATGALRFPFHPIGGNNTLRFESGFDDAAPNTTYAQEIDPLSHETAGLIAGRLPQGESAILSFVHQHATAANNTTSTIWVMLGCEVGDGEMSYEPALILACTAGAATVNAGSGILTAADAAQNNAWVDTIVKTNDYTQGAVVLGLAAEGRASIKIPTYGASHIIVMVVDAGGTATAVAALVRGT
jgi:hypothetical protein